MADGAGASSRDDVVLSNGDGLRLQCQRGRLRSYAPDSIVSRLLGDLPSSAGGILLPGASGDVLERLHQRLAGLEPPPLATPEAALQLLRFCDCYDLPRLARDAHAFWTRSPAAALAALDTPPARLAPASAWALRLHLSCWVLGHSESIAELLRQPSPVCRQRPQPISPAGGGRAASLSCFDAACSPLRIQDDILALAREIEADDVAGTARALCTMPLPWGQTRLFATEEVADQDLGRRTRLLHATPLVWAVTRRRSQVVELLLRSGADPNANMVTSHTLRGPNNVTVYQDRDEAQVPALHLALEAGSHQIVALLNAWGADRHATSTRCVIRRWRASGRRGIQSRWEQTVATTDEVLARAGC